MLAVGEGGFRAGWPWNHDASLNTATAGHGGPRRLHAGQEPVLGDQQGTVRVAQGPEWEARTCGAQSLTHVFTAQGNPEPSEAVG